MSMTSPAVHILWLSMANAALAFAVTEARLFRPVREWFKGRSPLLGELFSCGYCFGHWTAFGLVAIYRPRLLVAWWPLDYFLTALVIAWLGAFQWGALCWIMKGADK